MKSNPQNLKYKTKLSEYISNKAKEFIYNTMKNKNKQKHISYDYENGIIYHNRKWTKEELAFIDGLTHAFSISEYGEEF